MYSYDMRDAQLFVYCYIADAPKYLLQTSNPSQKIYTCIHYLDLKKETATVQLSKNTLRLSYQH